jgi:hypothetical protein
MALVAIAGAVTMLSGAAPPAPAAHTPVPFTPVADVVEPPQGIGLSARMR